MTTRRGTPSARTTAVAETASGGETIAPSAIAAGHDRPGISQRAHTATAAVVASTSPTASSVIGRALARKSRSEVK